MSRLLESRRQDRMKEINLKNKQKERLKEREKEAREREARSSNGHLFTSLTVSSTTLCSSCNRSITAKEALSCPACNVTIHNRCRDSLASCAKMKQRQQKLALVRNSSALQNVALRTKTAPMMKERPSSAIYPSDSLRQSLLGSRRVRSGLSLAKSVSTNNIAGGTEDSVGLRRILSQSTESLNFRSRTLSMESLTDDGEWWWNPLLEELQAEGSCVQADSWSLAVEPTFLQTLHKDLIKQQDVIYELIQTEFHHVRTLRIMEGVYRRGMQEEVMLEPGVVHTIFPCLDQMLELHSSFLSELLNRRKEGLVEGSTTNFTVRRLGDLLLRQFSGQFADDMKKLYSEFCSRHPKAVKLYKEVSARDRRLQQFIRRVCRGPLLRRHGIQECILLVTQRITKYPVLIQRILDNTKGNEEEAQALSRALCLLKGLISSVDQEVLELDRTRRLQEIQARLDPRAQAEVRGGGVFRGGELLRRRLLHEGTLQWKVQGSRMKDVQVLLMSDILVFLQEKDQKFTFASLDKSPVVSLNKLIVRDIANQERGMYLISDTPPEMYELHVSSKGDRRTWMSRIQQAVLSCPSRDEFPLIETEDKALLRRLRGGALYYIKGSGKEIKTKVLCGAEEANNIFVDFHASPTGAHCGQKMTRDAICKRFFWPGMTTDIDKWVSECAVCQSAQHTIKQEVQYTPIKVTQPFELVGMDLIGKLATTKNGNNYVCVIIDYFTKWPQAYPLKTKRAEEVTDKILKFVHQFEAPKRILTDQGGEFVNEINKNVCQKLGIKRSLCAPYHPQTNGLVERMNGTIQKALSKLVGSRPQIWDEYLDAVMFGLRTKKQATTKFSPYFLMFGREARYPTEIPEDFELDSSVEETVGQETVSQDVRRLDKIRDIVMENVSTSQQRTKQRMQPKGSKFCFEVGDKVWRKNVRNLQRKGGKLEPTFLGPFIITTLEGKSADLLGDDGKVFKKINTDHLKHFRQQGKRIPHKISASVPAASVPAPTVPAALGPASPGPSSPGLSATGPASPGLSSPGLSATGPASPGLSSPGLSATGPASPGPSSPGPFSSGPSSPGPFSPGLSSPGLSATGLSATGPASPGPSSPGLSSPGLSATGPASPGPASPGRSSPGLSATGPASPGPSATGPATTATYTDAEIRKYVDAVWTGKHSSDHVILSKIGKYKLFCWDFARIAPDQELESEVINAYLTLLVQKYNIKNKDQGAVIDSFELTRIWTTKTSKLKMDPEAFKIILGIFNEHHHWMLMVIYPHEKKALFVDPMGESQAKIKRCLESTRAFMRRRGCKVSRWACSTLPHGLQRDGTSCGVLALKFAQCVLEGQPLIVDTCRGAVNNMREDIASTLLRESESLKNLCHHCGSEGTDDLLWIACDKCSRWYHHDCVKNPDVNEEYLCPLCMPA